MAASSGTTSPAPGDGRGGGTSARRDGRGSMAGATAAAGGGGGGGVERFSSGRSERELARDDGETVCVGSVSDAGEVVPVVPDAGDGSVASNASVTLFPPRLVHVCVAAGSALLAASPPSPRRLEGPVASCGVAGGTVSVVVRGVGWEGERVAGAVCGRNAFHSGGSGLGCFCPVAAGGCDAAAAGALGGGSTLGSGCAGGSGAARGGGDGASSDCVFDLGSAPPSAAPHPWRR